MRTTTHAQNILALNRMLQGAEESAYAAELELAAAQAELLQLREVVDGQQALIAAQNHNAVLAHQAYLEAVAERDQAIGMLVAGGAVWDPRAVAGWCN